jgi:hypothetical protein
MRFYRSSPILKNIPIPAHPKSNLQRSPSRLTEGRIAIVTGRGGRGSVLRAMCSAQNQMTPRATSAVTAGLDAFNRQKPDNRPSAIYQFSAYVDLGGLASYGASLALMGKQTARYAAKIFQGAKPAELPVEQPVAFELALNLKTAAALGLSIPAAVIARADKVIE